MNQTRSFTMPGVSASITFDREPLSWDFTGGTLSIAAGPRTDLFYSPEDGKRTDTAPAALFSSRDADFVLSSRVEVDHESTFDAGVLVVRSGAETWAKICFELSPRRVPTIVSVVTRGTSDDCNSTPFDGSAVFLRIARRGSAFAFHWSPDEGIWDLVRHFTLGPTGEVHVGFLAQAPTGDRCAVRFSKAHYAPTRLGDIRSGE